MDRSTRCVANNLDGETLANLRVARGKVSAKRRKAGESGGAGGSKKAILH